MADIYIFDLIINSEANLPPPQHLKTKMNFFLTLANGKKSLDNVTRRSIIDTAEVLDTPLRPLTIKSLKMNKRNNCKIMSTTENLVNQFFEVGNFPGIFFSGEFFWTPCSIIKIFQGRI